MKALAWVSVAAFWAAWPSTFKRSAIAEATRAIAGSSGFSAISVKTRIAMTLFSRASATTSCKALRMI